MNSQDTFPCDGLIDYIAGEGTNIERKRFERHLASCSACKEEAVQLREAWDSLPDQAELLELPADLKDQVFRPLFIEEDNETA
jgi:anti-sigma factor RsiW